MIFLQRTSAGTMYVILCLGKGTMAFSRNLAFGPNIYQPVQLLTSLTYSNIVVTTILLLRGLFRSPSPTFCKVFLDRGMEQQSNRQAIRMALLDQRFGVLIQGLGFGFWGTDLSTMLCTVPLNVVMKPHLFVSLVPVVTSCSRKQALLNSTSLAISLWVSILTK